MKFSHPNLLKVRQIRTHPHKWVDNPPKGHRDDDLCLVSDLALCDLSDLCHREELTEHRAKDIIVQLLLAVEYLHNNGYIHRDIRPDNILVFKRDRIRLCDYGFCEKYHKYDDFSMIVNALYFRAPEILTRGGKYGFPSDIWATGCVMHYILTRGLIPTELDNHDVLEFTVEEQLQSLVNGYPFKVDKSTLGNNPVVKEVNFTPVNTPIKFMGAYSTDHGSKISDKKAYLTFLFQMLAFNQHERKTATEMLASPYLQTFSRNADLTRKSAVNILEEEKVYEVTHGPHRNVLKGSAISLFMELREKDWYSDKILFTGIDLYDRLLTRSAKIRGLSETNHQIYFRSCMYISCKYYTSHYICDLRYSTFPLEKYKAPTMKLAKAFEDTVLEILNYDLYRSTLLDEYISTRVASTKVTMSLLLFVIEGRHKDLTPGEAFLWWKEEMNDYGAKATEILKKVLT